ncbi:MAG: hypothetical protein ACTSVB_02185 [Candidatus Heimdallarchaeaceae archaeon]
MKNKIIHLFLLLLFITTLIPMITSASSDIDFRDLDFSSKGYDITYRILEGKNIGSLFSDIGFNLSGSLSGSEFHVLLKNQKREIRDVYSLESNTVIQQNTSIFIFDNYIQLKNKIEFSSELTKLISQIKIGDNFLEPTDDKKISTSLPYNSTIPIPSVFSQVLFPNFNSIITNNNYFDFLPIILGTEYERYEAEFSFLQLTGNFTVNIYNIFQDYFTVSLRKTDSSLIIKSSWNKNNGLLQSLSIQFKHEETTNLFSIEYKDFSEIGTPEDSDVVSFFISNSSADLDFYNGPEAKKIQLESATRLINNINNTEAFRYLIQNNGGLSISWTWQVLDPLTQKYAEPSILQETTFLSQMEPVIIPNWDMNIGVILFLKSIGESLEEQVQDYRIKIGNRTEYSISINKFNIQLQEFEQFYYLLVDFDVSYQRKEISYLASRTQIQQWNLSYYFWLSYSKSGILSGFSISCQEINHFYFEPFDIERETHYKFDYKIESTEKVHTIPTFTIPTTKTPISRIIFVTLLVITVFKKKKKKEVK